VALASIVSDYNTVAGAWPPRSSRCRHRSPPSTRRCARRRLAERRRQRVAVAHALRRGAATGPGRGAAALTRTDALLDQIAGSVQPGELPAVLRSLKPVVRDLPQLRDATADAVPLTTPVTDCIASNVVPTLNKKIEDGVNSTSDPVYLDLMHLFTGLRRSPRRGR